VYDVKSYSFTDGITLTLSLLETGKSGMLMKKVMIDPKHRKIRDKIRDIEVYG
jgi:hypothetical protein